MTRTRIYLIIQAVLCALLVVLLSLSAVTIYRDGAARKAEQPLEPIYTRGIVAEKFAPIAPLFFAAIGLMIAGLVLGSGMKTRTNPSGPRNSGVTSSSPACRSPRRTCAWRGAGRNDGC